MEKDNEQATCCGGRNRMTSPVQESRTGLLEEAASTLTLKGCVGTIWGVGEILSNSPLDMHQRLL